jgi:hypothetical protein
LAHGESRRRQPAKLDTRFLAESTKRPQTYPRIGALAGAGHPIRTPAPRRGRRTPAPNSHRHQEFRFMRKLVLPVLLALAIGVSVDVRPAQAIAQFQAVFIKEYITDHKDKDFAKYVKTKVRCHVCHQGKSVSAKNLHHNAYGKHLIDLLDAEKDKKDVDKIKAAIEKVNKMHSDPKDEKSPTYGELLDKSILPGGELEDVKKDPEEEKK